MDSVFSDVICLGGKKMWTSKYCHYNPELQPRARRLRHRATKAEACLWKYVLRARKMMGFQFRRQRPVLWYIADFMCKELKLIIECDGVTHLDPDVQAYDRKRQRNLEQAGYHVIRFADRDVLHSIDSVRQEIASYITSLLAENEASPKM
jgi:very-short-patch-repair endonuclease